MPAAPPLMLSVFPTFAVGGAQIRFVQVAGRLGATWRHAVISMDGERGAAERLAPDLDVTFPDVTVTKGDLVGNVRRFRACLRSLRPDVLVTHNWGTIEWAMANLLPLARHVHIEDGFGPEERSRQIPRRVWTRFLVLRRAAVVLPSRTLERIALDIWGLPRGNVRYLPNGIDLERFVPRNEAPLPAEPVIGTVAALRPEKNLSRLIGAVARVRERRKLRLAIVGDGPERPGLEARAAALGIGEAVTFHGHQPDPSPFYSEFDLFGLSSDTEQMPISVLEAMSSGLAVASTDVGDVRSMLSAENTPLVVPQDEAALADAIARALEDPALRRSAGTANRRKAEREFDERTMVDRYSRLFAGLG